MIWVIGVGTAIVLGVSLIGAYAIQSMTSSRRGQDFGSAVQAAQAGVDDFVARLNAGASFATAAAAAPAWTAVPGSKDADGTACTTALPNCPQFRYSAVQTGNLITVTAGGKSRGIERSVQVTTKKLGFTDYLYYSEVEAADPTDKFAYPDLLGGAPANCGNRAGDVPPRPAACKVPAWRTGDSTDGSRVHTADVFEAVGDATFDSRVTAAGNTCAADATACVIERNGADPDFNEGDPTWADDLTMPTDGLADIRTAAAAAAGGCTYYGPTRIKFENNKMRVWSPQTPNTPACGGGIPSDLLNTPVNVVVTTLNQAGVCSLALIGGLLCAVLRPLGSVVTLPLSNVLNNSLLTGLGLRDAVNGLVATGTLVDIPTSGAIYVQENPAGTAAAPPAAINPADPTFVQCLLGSALGMYSTVDTNVVAGLLTSANVAGSNCRAGKLFVDGVLDGKVTAGVSGDIIIMGNTTYRTSDSADDDRLGLIATGPVEVYNPLQCVLAVGTCLSLESLPTGLLTSLSGLRGAVTTGDLSDVLQAVPGYGDDVTVEASILSRDHRFGMQLPLLTVGLTATVLNELVGLNITPPTLTVRGSIAQKYRGVIAADLLNVSAGVGVLRLPALNLAAADVDIGYKTNFEYDGALRSTPPLYFPQPLTAPYDRLTFAEL